MFYQTVCSILIIAVNIPTLFSFNYSPTRLSSYSSNSCTSHVNSKNNNNNDNKCSKKYSTNRYGNRSLKLSLDLVADMSKLFPVTEFNPAADISNFFILAGNF